MYEDLVRQLQSMELLRQRLEIMDSCLAQLGYEDRLVLDMLCIHPESGNLTQLCDMLNVGKSSVYRRKYRILQKIKKQFVENGVGSFCNDF